MRRRSWPSATSPRRKALSPRADHRRGWRVFDRSGGFRTRNRGLIPSTGENRGLNRLCRFADQPVNCFKRYGFNANQA